MKLRIGRPGRRGPALVDLIDDPLDLLAVGQVLGQALPRRVDERAEHHPLAPLRVPVEQVVVGEEAPHQVLGQLDAIDPGDRAPDRRSGSSSARQRLGAGRAGGHLGQVVGIGGQRRHEGGGVAPEPQSAVGGEGVGPARRRGSRRRGGRPAPRAARRPRRRAAPAASRARRRACGRSGPRRRSGRCSASIGPSRLRW